MKTTTDALVEAALKRAFSLGQTHWQQADSDFTSHHRKAEATRQNFLVMCEETLAALALARAEQAEPVPSKPCRVNPQYRGPSNCNYGTVGCTEAEHRTTPPAPVPQPVQVEPVAYRWWETKLGYPCYRYDETPNPYGECEPLYADSPPPPEQKPLGYVAMLDDTQGLFSKRPALLEGGAAHKWVPVYAALRTALAQPVQVSNELSGNPGELNLIPDGWRLVPVEPTEAMLAAAVYLVEEPNDDGVLYNYTAMLAAAPPPLKREPLPKG